MIVVTLKYKVSIETIYTYLDKHKIFIRKYLNENQIFVAGPSPNKDGGIIIFFSSSTEFVENIMKNDPFVANNLVDHQLTPFLPLDYHNCLKNMQSELKL